MSAITSTVEKVIKVKMHNSDGYTFDSIVITEKANKIVFDTSDNSNFWHEMCLSPWNPNDFSGAPPEFETDPGFITYTKEGVNNYGIYAGVTGSRTIIEFHYTEYYGTIFFFYSKSNTSLCGQIDLAPVDYAHSWGPRMILDGLRVSDAQGDTVTRNTYVVDLRSAPTVDNLPNLTYSEVQPFGSRYTASVWLHDDNSYRWPDNWDPNDGSQYGFWNFGLARYARLSEYQGTAPDGLLYGDPDAPQNNNPMKKYAIWKYTDPSGSPVYRIKQLKWRIKGGKGTHRTGRFPPNSDSPRFGLVGTNNNFYDLYSTGSFPPWKSTQDDGRERMLRYLYTPYDVADQERLILNGHAVGREVRGNGYQLHSEVTGVDEHLNYLCFKCRNHLLTVHASSEKYYDNTRHCWWGTSHVSGRWNYKIYSANRLGAEWMREHYFFDRFRSLCYPTAYSVYVWLNYFDGINEPSLAQALEASPGRTYASQANTSQDVFVIKGYQCNIYYPVAVPGGAMTAQYIDNIEQTGTWAASFALSNNLTRSTWRDDSYYVANLARYYGTYSSKYYIGNQHLPFYEAFSDFAVDPVVIDV
jgi:hypothetical protein